MNWFKNLFKDKYLYIKIESQEHLEEILKKKGYTKYVNHKESYKNVEKKYPFLKYFRINEYSMSYSSERINRFFGKKIVDYKCFMSSYTINKIINYYNKKL